MDPVTQVSRQTACFLQLSMHKGSKNSFVPGEILKYFEPSRTKQLIWRPTLEVGHWPSYVGFNATVGRIGQLVIGVSPNLSLALTSMPGLARSFLTIS